ncbi:hypothetical protein GCM10010156_55970 [Planobispora rosea]|uniref:Ig-like domain-containing protein n=1 Tax=Planobispora rosea TaxID=35762 RepID=A0A8J3WGL1_PLARO|nr:hypothetical protein [Planobispora rosea]GGS90404.1 hypothetical protein GCM10010156_55970 [Planobispora rosea]GIH86971.1 hypothetical protein Pro02_53790 [Planobispora rosea]
MLATMAAGLLATPAAAATGSAQAGKTASSAKPAVFAGTPKVSFSGEKGECPVRVTFSSKIKVKAVKGKTVVAYRWLHGDGSKSKVKTFTVGKGVKSVTVKESTTFKGDVKGWQALQVLSPRKATSKKAYFKVSCEGEKPEVVEPEKRHWHVDADAWVDEGRCEATLIGRISVSSPRWVHYRWVVNGHVVERDSVKVYDSRKVYHKIRPHKSLRGWAVLEIVGPRHAESNRVGFKIWCKDWSPKVSASVSAPADYTGACPVERNFSGTLSVSHGRGKVTYRWIRNGVAGDWETTYVHGSRVVFDPWKATESGTATRAIELYRGPTTGTVTGKVTCAAPVTVSYSNLTAKVEANCATKTVTVSGSVLVTATGPTTVKFTPRAGGKSLGERTVELTAGNLSKTVDFSGSVEGIDLTKAGSISVTVEGQSYSVQYGVLCPAPAPQEEKKDGDV